jgi:CRISPR-associated protein Csb2
MPRALVIRVHFHDGRYHGAGDWPPSPARLFQALVAAAGLNGKFAAARDSLEWLERRPSPPIIGAPSARRGQRVMFYMPNNDLDAVQGDPRRFAEIRTAKKFFSPWLFDAATPLLYVWRDVPDTDEEHAQAIISLADQLYQLGRGIDMAWAWGELLDSGAEDMLASHAGSVYRPSAGDGGVKLPCPQPGSLASTESRYQAYRRRFWVERKGRTVKLTFRQPPRTNFQPVTYGSPPFRHVYELRAPSSASTLASWPVVQASRLVVYLRDGAAKRLQTVLPARQADVARVLVGRKPDGANGGPARERVRIVPLPSIGHPHADRSIRRVLVEIPAGGPIRADDLSWAFSGLEPIDPDTGEVHPIVLTPALSHDMLRHYGIGDEASARTWRTVTPAAIPDAAGRRRIDPARKLVEAKGGAERVQEQQRAAAAVIQALRHANVRTRVVWIRVQREPFEGSGERVEAFAAGTRFPKERLWHVEIRFAEPVSGPVVVGDGRFLGLGVMAPLREMHGIHVFAVEAGIAENPEASEIARALRRAVMARVQETRGPSWVMSPFFSGHERDGIPARSERHPHLAFVFHAREERLLVIAPHVIDQRTATREEQRDLEILDDALRGLRELRAGSAGVLKIRAATADTDTDSLFAASQIWESVTPYQVTRHARGVGAQEALAMDLRAECRRRGLPEPVDVHVVEAHGVAGVGLVGRVSIVFAVAVRGPILLGRSRYLGGGLFGGGGSGRMQLS